MIKEIVIYIYIYIYLSTAIGLTPGGSVTVHTINTYNNTIITEQHNNNGKTIAQHNDNYF